MRVERGINLCEEAVGVGGVEPFITTDLITWNGFGWKPGVESELIRGILAKSPTFRCSVYENPVEECWFSPSRSNTATAIAITWHESTQMTMYASITN